MPVPVALDIGQGRVEHGGGGDVQLALPARRWRLRRRCSSSAHRKLVHRVFGVMALTKHAGKRGTPQSPKSRRPREHSPGVASHGMQGEGGPGPARLRCKACGAETFASVNGRTGPCPAVRWPARGLERMPDRRAGRRGARDSRASSAAGTSTLAPGSTAGKAEPLGGARHPRGYCRRMAKPKRLERVREEARLRDDARAGCPRDREATRAAGASSSRSTTRGACTGTCASSTTACSPRGRSRTASPTIPKHNRKAVHTEDHPLEYLDFEGEIPQGQVRRRDDDDLGPRAPTSCEKWRDDEVIVVFHGERLTGPLRAVPRRARTKDWMIHRMDPAEPGREPMPERVAPMLARLGELPPRRDRLGASRSSGTACAPSPSASRAGCACRAATSTTSPRAIPSCAGCAGRSVARGGPRRRDRRLRRGRAAELRAPPAAHARGLARRGSGGWRRRCRSST